MISSLNYKLSQVAFQTVLFACLAGYSMTASGQGKTVSTVIQQDNEHTISVVYQIDNQMHCTTPIRYTMRKTGTTRRNQVMTWTIRYVPCNSQTVLKQTVVFSIPKGTGVKESKIDIKTRNMVSVFDEGSLVPKTIEEPEFNITGPASIMEGDNVEVSIQTSSSAKGVRWVWTRGAFKDTIGSGYSISRRFMSTTRIYAYPVIEGFVGSPKSFTVNVVKRPDAPSDFTFTGPREITDIETATLMIEPNTTLPGVKWIWEQENKKIGEGLSITVEPKQSVTYTVHSEYFWKKSPEKSFQLKVRILPSPPDDFEIAAPARINEGERVWLQIANAGSNRAVRWKWINQKTREEQVADSILVSPDETTTYSVMADLNGKLSGRKTKTIEVIQKAASPDVVGEFKKCISSTKPLKFTLQGGKLGTGSKYWNWYEGECGSGKLIHRGNELNISPSKTTTYYVQPENNKTVCRKFTIEVGEMPVLPERLTTVSSTPCYKEIITVEAVGNWDTNTRWQWYEKIPGSLFGRYRGEGTSILDTITATTQYSVIASNQYCASVAERRLTVEVRQIPVKPTGIYVSQQKRRLYSLSQVDGRLTPGYKWVWYKKDFDGAPIGYGEEISYRARKTDTILVRAEGNCGPTGSASREITYFKSKLRFIFVNFALSTNKAPKEFYENNFQFTIGSNGIYFRGRAPLSLFQPKSEKPLGETKLETDNTRITNYPANTNTYYQYNGEKKSEVYSASAGLLLGGKVIKIYLGGGYGKRTLHWCTDIFDYTTKSKKGIEWAKQVNQAYSGLLLEGGVFVRLGAFNITAGMNMISTNNSNVYRAFDAGIGFTFKRK